MLNGINFAYWWSCIGKGPPYSLRSRLVIYIYVYFGVRSEQSLLRGFLKPCKYVSHIDRKKGGVIMIASNPPPPLGMSTFTDSMSIW